MPTILKTGERMSGVLKAMRRRMINLRISKSNRRHVTEEYKRLFEMSPLGIIVMDMDGVVKACSPAVYRETGYAEEDYLGKHFSQIATLNERDMQKYGKLFEAVVNGDKIPPFEWIYRRKDGTFGWSEVYCSLLEEKGRKSGIMVLKRDITECKLMKDALRESEDKFTKAFRASPNLFIITRVKDNVILDANDSFINITGYPREEVIGRTAMELNFWVNPEERDGLMRMLEEQGTVYNEEYDFHMKSGEIRTGLVSAQLGIFDDEPCVIFQAIDVTERKRAGLALRESEEKHRDLLENTSDLIQSVTPDGHFRYVNKAWRQALGYSEEEVADLTLFDVIHPDHLQHCQKLFPRIISGENVGKINTAFISKNGSKIIAEGYANCKFINGKPAYTRGIFRDITRSKYLEEQMFCLSSAVSMSKDYVVITDFDAKIINVNERALEISGADSKDELIGRHFLELIAPADRAMVNTDVGEILKRGSLECREYHILSRDGLKIPMQISTSLVRDADGHPMGMVRVGRKISKPESSRQPRVRAGRSLS